MARPRLDVTRSEVVSVRFTPAELEKAQDAARMRMLPLSTYLRRRSLNAPLSQRIHHHALVELIRIGVNLNQIARVANAQGRINPEDPHFKSLLRELSDTAKKLLK